MIVRYRKFPQQVLVPFIVLVLPAFVAFCAAGIFEPSVRPVFGQVIRPILGIFVSSCFALVVIQRDQYCTVTPDGITIHGVQGKMVRWADVVSIDVENFMYERTVVLVMANCKRVRLPAPTSLLDRRFDEKLQFIRETYAHVVR
jgi:hypothetical protein